MYEFLKQLWFSGNTMDLAGMSISMIPNVLQLAGAIFTLITAVLTGLGLFQNAIQKVRIIIPGSMNVKQPEENDIKVQIIKSTSDLRKFARELAYAITGIILIVFGYIFAATGLDYIEYFSIYFLGPIILLLIVILFSGYNFLKPLIVYRKFFWKRLLFTLLFSLFTSLFFYLIYLFKWFAIASAFLGTTTLFIYLVIIFLENRIVNSIINMQLKNALKSNVDQAIEVLGIEANNAQVITASQVDEAKRLYELIKLDTSITSIKDYEENEKK